jgi:glucose dehydrogenase
VSARSRAGRCALKPVPRRVWAVGAALLLIASLAAQQLTYERIRNSAAEPGNWLTYSGNYSSHRHSALTQITRENVYRLSE